jgi:hypothetical protein
MLCSNLCCNITIRLVTVHFQIFIPYSVTLCRPIYFIYSNTYFLIFFYFIFYFCSYLLLRVLRFYPVNIIPPLLHTHISHGGWTAGPLVTAVHLTPWHEQRQQRRYIFRPLLIILCSKSPYVLVITYIYFSWWTFRYYTAQLLEEGNRQGNTVTWHTHTKLRTWPRSCVCTEAFTTAIKVNQPHNTPMVTQGKTKYSSYWFMTLALDGVRGQRHASAAHNSRRKDPQYSLDRRLGGPLSRSGHSGFEENPLASAGEPTSIARSSSPQSDTILTELPRLSFATSILHLYLTKCFLIYGLLRKSIITVELLRS